LHGEQPTNPAFVIAVLGYDEISSTSIHPYLRCNKSHRVRGNFGGFFSVESSETIKFMLQLRRDNNSVWILIAALFYCCSTGVVHGEDTSGPNPDSSIPSSAAGASRQLPPRAETSSPAIRDLKYYLESTWSFRNVLEAGFIAGVPTLTSEPVQPAAPAIINEATFNTYENEMNQYSDAMDEWRRSNEVEMRYHGRRFAFGLATAETRDLYSNLLLPLALRQDPRYLPGDLDASLGSRLGYAAESVFVTNDNAGRRVPNISKLGGTVGAALTARYLYADHLGVSSLNSNRFMGQYIGYSLAGDVATNVARELLRTSVKQDLIRYDERGRVTGDNYYPLSTGGTLVYWAKSTVAPRNFIAGALIAGLPNVPSQPDFPTAPTIDTKASEIAYDEALVQYGDAMQDWRRTTDEEVRYHGKRFIGGFSESETQLFLGNCLFPLTFRMDPRYIQTGSQRGVGARMQNALAQIFVSRTDSGGRMLNLPLLGSTVGAAYIAQQLYYDRLGVPDLATNRLAGKTIGFNLAGDLVLNLTHEFLSR
jgi:hypothetical protein